MRQLKRRNIYVSKLDKMERRRGEEEEEEKNKLRSKLAYTNI
jgi:hypothetical protein